MTRDLTRVAFQWVIIALVGLAVVVYFRGRWGTFLDLAVSIPIIIFWIVAVMMSYAFQVGLCDELRDEGRKVWVIPRVIGQCLAASIIPVVLLWLIWR